MERAPVRASLILAIVPTLVLALIPRAPSDVAPHRASHRTLQAAATRDGFLVLEHAPLQRVVPVARDGRAGDGIHLPRLPTDARAIGLRNGERALVYQAGRRVQIDAIGDDGELAKLAEFGTRVHGMCDGMASNEHRFAVAWTEVDGKVWFVHGPTGATAQSLGATAEVASVDAAFQPSYCAAAMAGEQVALLWQDGQNVNISRCTTKRCSHATKLKLTGSRQVRAFGCTRSACAIAAQTPDGATDLGWVGSNGKLKWAKRIDVAPRSELSIVGAGQQHIVVGYVPRDGGSGMLVADESGRIHAVWAGEGDAAPWLVWSRDRLLFVRHVGGQVAIGIMMKRDDAFVVDERQ